MPEQDLPELARLLRSFRESRGIASQQALADLTRPKNKDGKMLRPQVSASTIGMVELGKRGLSPRFIEILALVMGLDDDEQVQLRRAAGHDRAGALDTFGVVSRLDSLEDRFDKMEEAIDSMKVIVEQLEDRFL